PVPDPRPRLWPAARDRAAGWRSAADTHGRPPALGPAPRASRSGPPVGTGRHLGGARPFANPLSTKPRETSLPDETHSIKSRKPSVNNSRRNEDLRQVPKKHSWCGQPKVFQGSKKKALFESPLLYSNL